MRVKTLIGLERYEGKNIELFPGSPRNSGNQGNPRNPGNPGNGIYYGRNKKVSLNTAEKWAADS